ncbi:MAG: PH domain-containing protein [Nakamurella sp.]
MIDFQNGSFVKLRQVNPQDGTEMVAELLVDGEGVYHAFKTVRDMVIFTNRRIIAVNVQGLTGRKRDYSTLPYSKVQAFSIETAGHFDLDAELELWFSGLGKVRFEFTGGAPVKQINQMLSAHIL